MEEINEAWSMLRSPALRAAYDDELGSRAVSPAGGVGLRRPAPLVVDEGLSVPAPMTSRPAADDGETAGGCGTFLVLSVVFVAAVFVIGIAVAIFSSGDPATVEVRTRERFAPGTCVLVSPRGSMGSGGASGSAGAAMPASAAGNDVDVEEVACTAAAVSGKVTAKVAIPLPCPGEAAAVVFAADNQTVCIIRR